MYIEREICQKALNYIFNEDIIIFTGARQTGKTTILHNIERIIKNKYNKFVFFINLEDFDYLKILNESPKNLLKLIDINKDNETQYIFIDEIQYLDNPTNFLKYIYDEYREKIKLIVSGSSAFYIDKRFKDSLAGRKKIFYVRPLNFGEFLLFKGEKKLYEKYSNNRRKDNVIYDNFVLPDKRKIEIYFNEYLRFGGYPRVVLENNIEEKEEIIKEIATSYIKKDIFESKVNYIDKYYELLKIFAVQIGGLVNKYELSNILKISTTAIENYLYIMKKSFHISLIKPFFKNIKKELKRMEKIYFYDLGLRNYFYKNFNPIDIRNDIGALYENFIFIQFENMFDEESIKFWRTQNKNEVDFIIDEKDAYEIKYNLNTFKKSKYKIFLDRYKSIKFNVIFHKGKKDDESSEINYINW